MRHKMGRVYLVGAGPGDPGLLTLRGKELLERAEVLIYDRLANPRLLSFAHPGAERIYVGKRSGRHAVPQGEINRIIVEHARAGRDVVRLKGGDPFIFGRGGEEAQACVEAGISFEVVPGVTSAVAVPAYAGIPLTHREHTASVAIITGHRKSGEEDAEVGWEGLAKGAGTLVFLMGMKNLSYIVEQLVRYGRSPQTPAAVIEWGTTPRQRTVRGALADIAARVDEAGLTPPSVVVIGDVVRLKDEIDWFENRPLVGRRILVTRTREQASGLVALLEERGATCIELPTIKVVPPGDTAPLDEAINGLSLYDWLVLSSPNAVRFFLGRLLARGLDARALGGVRIAVVGSGTAEILGSYHMKPDLIPETFQAEGLLAAFERMDVKGKKVLVPRAKKAREVLPEGLSALGAEVTVVTAYETLTPELDPDMIEILGESPPDVVTFTSSSTAKNLARLLPPDLFHTLRTKARVACIGPVTAGTARSLGLEVSIMPEEATIPALVTAIEDYYRMNP